MSFEGGHCVLNFFKGRVMKKRKPWSGLKLIYKYFDKRDIFCVVCSRELSFEIHAAKFRIFLLSQ